MFVLRLSKILFGLQDDGSELSGGESESEEESKEDSRAESKQVLFEPVISVPNISQCANTFVIVVTVVENRF